MKRISSLPIIVAVAATGAACSTEVVVYGSGGAGGSGGSVSGGSGGTGGNPTTGGAGGTTSTSSSSSSGGAEPVCGQGEPRVAACILAPIWPWSPSEMVISGRLTAIGEANEQCFAGPTPDGSNVRIPTWGELPDETVWVTVSDAFMQSYIVGLSVPGLTADRFTVGASVDVTLRNFYQDFGQPAQWISVHHNGELLAAVAHNDTGSLSISEGEELCYEEDDICGYGDHRMAVTSGGESASVSTDETQQVGKLMVTNDHFRRLYDLGACNFADPVDFLYGVAAAP